jgi:hypothetical protein
VHVRQVPTTQDGRYVRFVDPTMIPVSTPGDQ